MKTIITNVRLLDLSNGFYFDKKNILIEDGIIKKIDNCLSAKDANILDMNNLILSPGFIDVHVHCFPEGTTISSIPDEIGVKRGVTTVIDAGTAGADTFDKFYHNFISTSKTRVFSCLNISTNGLETLSELDDMNKIDFLKISDTLRKYSNEIVALKVRASSSVVKSNGILPIVRGKEIANILEIPLVVHIGNGPPAVENVLNLLGNNDIVTHSYNNKKNNLVREGKVINEVVEAKKRGVFFDLGHGSASFSFTTGREALADNFEVDLISTDIYDKNLKEPVKGLIHTLNKMIGLGIPVDKCIEKVTSEAAKIFKLKNLGELKVGYNADFSIFDLENGVLHLKDSDGEILKTNQFIQGKYVFLKDELIKLEEDLNV